MTVERINWSTAATQGSTVVYGVLIAGLPYLLVGDTVSVASVTWTDTADPAWHVGTSPTTKPWLKLDELVDHALALYASGVEVTREWSAADHVVVAGESGWVSENLLLIVPVVAVTSGLLAIPLLPVGRWMVGAKRRKWRVIPE